MSHEEENVNQEESVTSSEDKAEDQNQDEGLDQDPDLASFDQGQDEGLDSRIAELEAEKEDLEEKVLRLQAEIQNLQRRHAKNREELQRFRAQDLAKDVLPSIDNLERALQIEVQDESGQNLKKGLEMVKDSLLQALANNQIEVIDPAGEDFDPNFHEAYAQVPGQEGQESNQVAEVFEKGYKLHDRVLRPAKVTVVE